ncbi:MAG: hypothetical protein AAF928_05945 [Myxococcota bacterium]
MKLIKTRPRVRLVLPTFVTPGDEVRAEVLLDARRPVAVDAVAVHLEGWESVGSSRGEHRREEHHALVGQAATLTGPTTLPRGRTTMACTFQLPPELPPTYDERAGLLWARVRYQVSVHVDIPWWPDRHERFAMVVQPRPQRRLQPDKTIFSPSPRGPRREEPHIEVAIDDALVVPGGTLRGQLAPYNVAFNRYGRTELAIVGRQQITLRGRALVAEVLRFSISLDLSAVAEADAVPFWMKLPKRLPVSFQSRRWRLDWFFEVRARHDFVRHLTFQVPIEILPPGSETKRRRRQAPLVIGSERIRRIWSDIARDLDFDYDPERGEIETRRQDTHVTIRREHRGADGIFLAATLRFPSLRMRLDGGSASSLRRVVGGGVSLGDTGWDRDHYLTAREHAQVASLLRPLAPLLLPVRLYDIDDTTLVVHHRDAGQSPRQLRWFATHVGALADALRGARVGVVPPATMAADRPAWEALARRMGASLQTTSMAVEARIEGHQVRVLTEWAEDDNPTHTRIELEPPHQVAERHHLSWSAPDTLRRGDLAELSPAARAGWIRLCAGALAVDVDRAHLVVVRPAPAPDPEALYGVVETLLTFFEALTATRGPYR